MQLTSYYRFIILNLKKTNHVIYREKQKNLNF